MNRLSKITLNSNLKFSILLNQSRFLSQTKPVLAGFAKDFKPGAYPQTESERLAAARKYGLKPEDYQPFPDDGFGFGDYPKLAPISTDMKSDFGDYDDPYLKRNFGEPIIVTQEQITADKVTLKNTYVSFPKIIFWFLFGSVAYIGLHLVFWDYKFFVPIAPKQYPRDVQHGEKHYTF